MHIYVQKMWLWFAHRRQLQQLSIFRLELRNGSFRQKWEIKSLPQECLFHCRAGFMCLLEGCCITFPGFKKWTLLSWTENGFWDGWSPTPALRRALMECLRQGP